MSVLLAAGLPVCSAADEVTTGSVRIVVQESFAKQPIPRANVKLASDDREYSGYSDATGIVTFATVRAGVYGITVDEPNYAFPKDGVVTVVAGTTKSLTIVGTRTSPRKIGGVRTKAKPQPNTALSVNEGEASAQIAGNSALAAASLPSVGTDGFGNLTIHNQGAGLTAPTVNGAPIFASGGAAQLNLFSSDAFTSVSVDAGGVLGAPGGALNFNTVDPTIDWGGLAQQRFASSGGSASSVQVRGTAGRVGVAASHTVTDTGSPIDGLNYLDTSGLFSSHDGIVQNESDSATIRYGFDPNHVGTLDAGRIQTTTPLVCRFQSGPIPCGFGPFNGTTETASFLQYRDQIVFNRGSLQLNLFGSQLRTDTEDGAQTIAGTNVGFSGSSALNRIGGTMSFSYPINPRVAALLSLAATRDTAYADASYEQRLAVPPSVTSLTRFDVKVPLIARPRFDLSATGGVNHGYGVTRPIDGIDASYRLTNRDFLTGSYSNGSVPSQTNTFAGVSPAQTVQPECSTGRAIVGGPQSVGAAGSTASVRGGINHQGDGFTADFSAFRDQTTNATVQGAIPGTALSNVVLPAGYYAQAAQTASFECGVPIGLSPLSTYFTSFAAVGKLVADGFDLGSQLNLGTHASIGAQYSLARARAFGASSLFVPGSSVVPGAQLPGRPLSQYQVNGKAALSRSTTLLLAATGTSADNAYALHPFVSVDAGIRLRASTADIVASVQNIGNVHGDPFVGFTSFPTLAQPFPSRTYSVRVRLALGRQNIDKAEFLSKPQTAGNSFSYIPQQFGEKPANGWLGLATDSPLCGPEKVPSAKSSLDAIAKYVSESPSAPNALVSGAMTLSRLPGVVPATYKIVFDMNRLRLVAPFAACSVLHFDTLEAARKLGIYTPGWRERDAEQGLTVYYTDAVGLYFAPNPDSDFTSARTYGPPGFSTKSGDARFSIVDANCPPESRAAVHEAVAALHGYIDATYAGRHPSPPDGFAVSVHTAKSENWLEIRAENFQFGFLLADCLDVPSVLPKQVAQKGLGAASFPSLNYAPAVGFYTLVLMADLK